MVIFLNAFVQFFERCHIIYYQTCNTLNKNFQLNVIVFNSQAEVFILKWTRV